MKSKKEFTRRKFIPTIGTTTAVLPLMNSSSSNYFNSEPEKRLI